MNESAHDIAAIAETNRHAPEAVGALSSGDLSELLAVFNDAASKLQTTHECLRAEVARLQLELQAANEELARSKRLAALGEMAAGIAHEVRNPLGSIRLHARMLEQDLADRPEERTIAEKILLAVRGLDAVVGDVLSFAKEMRVRKQPTDTAQLLRHAIDECLASDAGERAAGTAPESAVEVVVQTDESANELVCDSALVHRALVNVIRNGIQAMNVEKGERTRKGCALSSRRKLTVSASSRRVVGPDGGDRQVIALSVRDTGPGLDSEVMERMFNPFFTTRATGTGLGLAIVHRIVDAHAGSVKVRNHEQGGAVVELLFPASDAGLGQRGTDGEVGASVVVRSAARMERPAA